MAGFRLAGFSNLPAEVDSSNNLFVRLPTAVKPSTVGAALFFGDNDDGTVTGTPYISSPETDWDFRERVGLDIPLDLEQFDYAAQNTGKHNYANSTLTFAWGTGGLTTNSGSTTTNGANATLQTYAYFPFTTQAPLVFHAEISFSAAFRTNTFIDFGFFLPGGGTIGPLDGAYFSVDSAGIHGTINYNTTVTTTATFSLVPTVNQKYKFSLVCLPTAVEFWINDVLYASLDTPVGVGQPFAAAALPVALRHVISGGAASGALSITMANYSVMADGLRFYRTIGEYGNAAYGSYQGLSGGTMGSLATYPNSTDPTAQIPTNTTAALGTGLGGQVWETESNTFALTTDGIILSYQVPAGTVSVPGRRLKLMGIAITTFCQAVLVGGPYVAQWSLAFGHTAVSLATTETAASKAPRRIALGIQAVPVTVAAGTFIGTVTQQFQNPVYVNPGEFIAVVKKKVGTIATSGTLAHVIEYDYAWE